MSNNLHTTLNELKTELRNGGDKAYELSRAVLDAMPVTGYGREMRLSALDALDNVLDAATNSGTVENLFELRDSLENYGDFSPTQDNDETMKLLGDLWNFSFTPSYYDGEREEPLTAVIDAWNEEIGNAAHAVLMSYVETNFPEYNF